MNYNKITEAVHENAVAHGWWEEERNFATVISLIHSELSEALEAEREGLPFVFVIGDDGDWETGIGYFGNKKPEGAGIELVDAVIRILDLAGRYKVDVDALMAYKFTEDQTDIGTLIANCHWYVSEAYDKQMSGIKHEDVINSLCEVIVMIRDHIAEAGYSFERLLQIKHEYNTHGPYKHGKAF